VSQRRIYVPARRGRQASAFASYTINRTKGATEYIAATSCTLTSSWRKTSRGLLSWAWRVRYNRLRRIAGSGRVLALGPFVGKPIAFGKLPITFTIKYDFEFAKQNRLSGNALWFNRVHTVLSRS
jgi:hypothetical protein